MDSIIIPQIDKVAFQKVIQRSIKVITLLRDPYKLKTNYEKHHLAQATFSSQQSCCLLHAQHFNVENQI